MRKRVNALLVVCAILVLTGLSGCAFFVDQTLSSIQVSPQSPSVALGGTTQLTAKGVNNDGSSATLSNVNWSSSNTQVATVSASGLVTGVSAGSSTITASSGTVSGSTTVTVGSNAGSLTITPANQTVSSFNGVQQFTATFNGQDVTADSTWSSSNALVAQFLGAPVGLATFAGQGTTTITATFISNSGTVTGSTSLTVGP